MESFLTSSSNLIQQVKTASPSELDQLATEVRARILEVVSKTGGHLSSNLGTVELTLALYRSFNFPEEDVLVWDTGHQAYTHKLITGRADRFDTLRQMGGISGFTSRFESPYDSYGAGHVGTGVGAG
ncbi:MAG: 1-deoxy-D-xylulose-5-phosphate synthase, partial [Thermotogaceae bacterium]|nr:1-deoxy-D-xylulose-5-phosphate synthase [Thermotogaceae bacterium]